MHINNDLSIIKDGVKLSSVVAQTLSIRPIKPNEFIALCPFHTEKTPSFRVYDDTGRYHCFGCQKNGDVFEWLLKQRNMNIAQAKEFLMASPTLTPVKSEAIIPIVPVPQGVAIHQFKNPTHSTIHHYKDINGQLMFLISRYEADAGRKKWFSPAVYTVNGWIEKLPITENRPLYGLERLGAMPDKMVFITAGELKCDQAFHIAPSNPWLSWSGGDGAINKHDFTPLQDKVVVFLPDNSPECIALQHIIAQKVKKLYVVIPQESKPHNWDVGDGITKDGWGYDDLIAYIGQKVLYGAEKPVSVDVIPEGLFDAPGMVGRIMRWMHETALFPLPELEMGAAIAVSGIILAHKVKTRTNLRTNMLVMGICSSGAGKDHARKCIKSLLIEAGMGEIIGGKPKSGAAVLTMAAKNYGRCMCLLDELGRMLGAISGKYASSHQQEITTNIMELFSSSNTLFSGDELANRDGKSARIDIEQPCFNIYGVSTKENLYAAMSSKQAVDGFLSRWLVFEAQHPYDEQQNEVNIYDADYDVFPPETLIQEVKEWQSRESYNRVTAAPEPALVPFTTDAMELIGAFHQSIRKKLRTDAPGSLCGEGVFSSIWARVPEHANKLALCGHEDGEISAKVMQWGIDVAVFCAEKMLREIEQNIADNEHESNSKRVLGIIRSHKGIVRRDLTRKTQWLRDQRHRDEIIDMLLETEQITLFPSTPGDKHKRSVDRFFIKTSSD